ncbi:DUF6382 domain-containing protein [[Clostridium] aminophilum]|uniref:DUF6382 domain-containing protein n=1 Tax=[Clostridium] aminophilum TaxID=1526 RepID=UPI003F97CD03
MEVRYQREMTHNYMMIRAEKPEWSENYTCHMMEENTIPGLLAFQTRHTGQGVDFYYEITSRQPLNRIFERKKPDGETIRKVISQILDTLWVLEDYLLVEEGLVMDASYIYADPDTMEIRLCFVPGLYMNFAEKMKDFLRWIMERADHRDSRAVMLSYDLYEASLRENYGAEDLRRCLNGNRSSIFCEKEGGMHTDCDGKHSGTDGYCAVCEKKTGSAHGQEGSRTLPDYPAGPGSRPDFPENGSVKVRKTGRTGQEDSSPAVWKKGIVSGSTNTDRITPIISSEWRKTAGNRFPTIYLAAGFALELVLWFATGFRGQGFYAGIFCAVMTVILIVFRLTASGKAEPAEEEDTAYGEMTEAEPGYEWERETARNIEWSSSDMYENPVRYERRSQEELPAENRIRNETMERTEMPERKQPDTLPDGPYAELIPDPANDSAASDYEEIRIPYTPFFVGQNPDLTDCCIPDESVSPLHLRFDQDERTGEYTVTDLNSGNGTFVDGKMLGTNEQELLRDGDRLRIAGLEYRFAVKNGPVVM